MKPLRTETPDSSSETIIPLPTTDDVEESVKPIKSSVTFDALIVMASPDFTANWRLPVK